jgi:MFS family permease
VSLIFGVSTGATFSSLGVLLPAMIEELGWSWAQAGLGFTVIGLLTGLSSTVPAETIKRFGIRATYLTGGFSLAAGFLVFSQAQGLASYLIGAALIGLGYSQSGAVPAVHVLSGWFLQRRSLVIGVFFTSGAIGSIIGPIAAALTLTGLESWRSYWIGAAILSGVIATILALFVSDPPQDALAAELNAQASNGEEQSWEFKEVLRTPQYHIIILSVTITLLGALTMNTWQVTHMQNLGVAATITATALSMHALFNAASRIVGGVIIDRVGAKLLFLVGLASGVFGMAALSVADDPLLILIFAIGDGVSFGMVTFASSILLLDYFGAKNNPMILGFLNLITTAGMIGPVLAGYVADRVGGFFEVFVALSILMLVVFTLSLTMTKPIRPAHK